LIGAVIGVLIPIGKKYGIESPFHDSDIIKPEYKKVWIKKLHEAQNFSKHADKDSEDVLFYETDAVSFRILEACHLFRHLVSDKCLKYRQSPSAIMFEVWFCLKYPHLLKDQIRTNKFFQTLGMPKDFRADDFETLKILTANFRIKL